MKVLHLGFVALCLLGSAPTSHAQFGLQQIASGLTEPLYVAQPPGESNRLFICEKGGVIKIVKDGVLLPEPFLDISAEVDTFAAAGLLGLAFHPDFQSNGYFYVSYVGAWPNTAMMIAEYSVSQGNPDVAAVTANRVVLNEFFTNLATHFGGCLQFGPDGMLYASLGDFAEPDLAQDRMSNRGKILRFDITLPAPMIPADNPFVFDPATLDTIFDIGLRSPWRFSFDRANGDMWICDVGNAQREEVNYIPAGDTGRKNYGWPCQEANLCTGNGPCLCPTSSLTVPVQEYMHSTPINSAVIGGYVYRGSAIPELQGRFVHSDFIASEVRSLEIVGGVSTGMVNHTPDLTYIGTTGLSLVTSFGEDNAGELYIVDQGVGQLVKLVPVGVVSYCTSSPNSVGAGGLMDWQGWISHAGNDLTLLCTGVPNEFGLFFFGDIQVAAPFFDGTLCISVGQGSGLHRLLPPTSASGNSNSRLVDNQVPPGSVIQASSTWNFQYWYRDPFGPGGTGSNTSNALSIIFAP